MLRTGGHDGVTRRVFIPTPMSCRPPHGPLQLKVVFLGMPYRPLAFPQMKRTFTTAAQWAFNVNMKFEGGHTHGTFSTST